MPTPYTPGAIHILDPSRVTAARKMAGAMPRSFPAATTFDETFCRLISLCENYISAAHADSDREAFIFADRDGSSDFCFIIWDYPRTSDRSWNTRTRVLAGGLVYDRHTHAWSIHT